MTEQDIVNAIVEWLKDKNFIVATEVCNMSAIVDIGCISELGEVWAIECKLHAMKKVIWQAHYHWLVADKVYIGVPSRKIRKATLCEAEKHGVGIIFVCNGEVEIVKECNLIDDGFQFLPKKEEFVECIKRFSKLITREGEMNKKGDKNGKI